MQAVAGLKCLRPEDIALVAGGYQDEVEEVVVVGHRLQEVNWLDYGGGSSGFWFQSASGYQAGVDYCGSSFFDVPDEIYGVDISEACYNHDLNYSEDSNMDRSEADWQLAKDIYSQLTAHGVSEAQASEAAMIYHMGVRVGGWLAYEGHGSNQ